MTDAIGYPVVDTRIVPSLIRIQSWHAKLPRGSEPREYHIPGQFHFINRCRDMPPKRRGRSPEMIARIVQYVLDGHSLKETAKACHLHPETVRLYIRQAGYRYDKGEKRWVKA